MAAYLLKEIMPPLHKDHARQQPVPQTGLASEGIAVVSVACRLPGGGNSPAAFWRSLTKGVDGIVEIPPERFDVNAVYDPGPDTEGKCYVRHGGFIKGVELFDARFFGISAAEVRSMDPQQRLVLEVGYEALFRSGSSKSSLLQSSTGVFVGLSPGDWSELVKAGLHGGDQGYGAYFGTGVSMSIAANRLSFVLGLKGPSMSIDMACSSSLVALDAACVRLRRVVAPKPL